MAEVTQIKLGSSTYDIRDASKVPLTGGTMQGVLTAQNNTAYTTKQVRNVFLSTEEPTSADGANGDLWFQYEA